MVILLLFAFASGLATIAAPCIWPILPVILSSTSLGGRRRPLGITLGIMGSFAFLTLTLSYIVKLIPFDPNSLRLLAVFVIGFLGLTLVVPALNRLVEGAVSRLTSRLSRSGSHTENGFAGGLITGLSLGIVWSPCAGPILATIATLSSTRAVNTDIVLVTAVYVAGAGIPLFIFATLGRRIFNRSRTIGQYTGLVQRIFGVIMILTALAIFTNFDRVLQADLLNFIPSYSNLLTRFESTAPVQQQLNTLKGKAKVNPQTVENQAIQPVSGSPYPDFGPAPDVTKITHWLNTPQPLTLSQLKGKVVLVDFWTYTCINCIRTLPHLTAWYGKYKDKGLVIIGVHTPEFEFEKLTGNVENALRQFGITYPVAQDNDYATWNAFGNQYWPAEYLIDARGHLRRTAFGEGEYDKTETAIKALLTEAGKTVDSSIVTAPDQTPKNTISPETYLGTNRMERNTSASPPPLDYFSLNGDWDLQPEYAQARRQATLLFHFKAQYVYLVLSPARAGDTVKVYLDGKPVGAGQAGKDVVNGAVKLDMERLYNLIDLRGQTEEHTLKLMFENDNTKAFAFTFG